MIPVNPGNLLPFYSIGYSGNDIRWQRHRQQGQDIYPFGLPCPRTRLMPFQLCVEATGVEVSLFSVFNPYDDSETVIFDAGFLDVQTDGTKSWITWYADENLDVVPDCGFWYVFLNLGDAGQYYSEVLYLRDMCGFEKVGLTIGTDSCAVDGGNISFQLVADVEAGDGTTWAIQRKDGLSWNTISTGNTVTVVELLSAETREYRIQATTVCGLIITQPYVATWDDADGCGTFDFARQAISINEAGILSTPPVWRFNFSHSTDKANVLYQDGYEQYLYLPTIIWDRPEIVRSVNIQENGNGVEIRRNTRTKERRGFEVPDLPDYVLGWLAKAGDLDTITLEDAKLDTSLVPVEIPIENLTFESPNPQGPSLNTGRFYFDVEAEAFNGCQENFVLE